MVAATSLALVVAIFGGHVGATHCLPGIKQLLSVGSSHYAKLAEHLYAATSSTELKANTKIAFDLLSAAEFAHARQEYSALVRAFANLDNSATERLCSRSSMNHLRRVAEAMRRGGDLGPQRVSPATRRLNLIVIKLVNEARAVCFQHLERQLPHGWSPKFESPAVTLQVARLNYLPRWFLFGAYTRPKGGEYSEDTLANELSSLVSYNMMVSLRRDSMMSTVLLGPDPSGEKLRQLIDEPCDALMTLEESRAVLEPYVNLLISSYIVRPLFGSMDKFYQDASVKPHAPEVAYNERVLAYAKRLRACQRLKLLGHKNIAKLIRRSRRKAMEERDW